MKSLLILRGLPGSGKSTLAKILSEEGKYPVHCIDDYFVDPVSGSYKFDYKSNHLAYADCERRTLDAMQREVEKIIIDNAFTLEWELEPYFRMASENNYQVFVMTVENRHGNKNIHEINDEQIQKMAEKYKVVLY
jgi:predicted kinase